MVPPDAEGTHSNEISEVRFVPVGDLAAFFKEKNLKKEDIWTDQIELVAKIDTWMKEPEGKVFLSLEK
jgi:hypothetical protein